jgi:hypothetical protein
MAAELTISPETAYYIVEKARELEEKVEIDDPDSGSNPSDDEEIDVLEDAPGDPTAEELKAAIAPLNEDEQADLVALLWLGRGDYAAEQWDEARNMARERREDAVSRYIAGTPLASDYIEEGLSMLGHSISELGTGRR